MYVQGVPSQKLLPSQFPAQRKTVKPQENCTVRFSESSFNFGLENMFHSLVWVTFMRRTSIMFGIILDEISVHRMGVIRRSVKRPIVIT